MIFFYRIRLFFIVCQLQYEREALRDPELPSLEPGALLRPDDRDADLLRAGAEPGHGRVRRGHRGRVRVPAVMSGKQTTLTYSEKRGKGGRSSIPSLFEIQ